MLTIFSTPRPFRGHFDIIQKNAIRSWLKLKGENQIILIDDEEGTTVQVAKEFGLECIQGIEQNKNGTLRLDDVFDRVRKVARGKIFAHVNTDIILMSDFSKAIESISFPLFYMAGQRWNLDITQPINFESSNWESDLKLDIQKRGELHPPTGMDYWVFPREWNFRMPPFFVGRPAVDNWFIQTARKDRIPVIDATEVIQIIHQNHPRKTGDEVFEEETRWNRVQARNGKYPANKIPYTFLLSDADYFLTTKGPVKKPFPWNRFWKYSEDVEVLGGSRLAWETAFVPYRTARWAYRQLKQLR